MVVESSLDARGVKHYLIRPLFSCTPFFCIHRGSLYSWSPRSTMTETLVLAMAKWMTTLPGEIQQRTSQQPYSCCHDFLKMSQRQVAEEEEELQHTHAEPVWTHVKCSGSGPCLTYGCCCQFACPATHDRCQLPIVPELLLLSV